MCRPAYTSPLVVVKPGALGDTLLLAPALRALAQGAPGRPVTVVGTLPYAALLPILGVASRVLDFDRLRLFGPPGTEAGHFAGAVVAAFLGRPPEGPENDPFRARGARQTFWSPSRPPASPGLHAAEHLHRLLAAAAPEIRPLSRDPFVVHPQGPLPVKAPYAVLAPGAGSPAKRAPLELFRDVARKQAADGIRPVFLLGEAELEGGLDRELGGDGQLWRSPTLPVLAAGLAGAVQVVANDSGPAHLAGLLGVATEVFFGPTDPALWRPWGPRVRVVRF
jgi:ADP-heptose:LPS heptosyltransferase